MEIHIYPSHVIGKARTKLELGSKGPTAKGEAKLVDHQVVQLIFCKGRPCEP